jgi:putative spermidine/putrescine transport system ATP-binding protein
MNTTNDDVLARFVNLEKTYDGKTMIVNRLNLDIRRGEFLTLLGPSGSGKTTCLMMLAGFEPWTGGDIELNGRSMRKVPAYKRGIGVVFQNYALFPHMTVAQNVAFPLRQRKTPANEVASRVKRAIDMVELGALADRHPTQLSGGQQQRVALARSLVFEPDLVLMDEPLGALDKRLREQMQFEIKALHAKIGMTVVYVTHDQGEALTMSDRIAVFNKGRIEQIGSPDEVYERPATAFVANFVGENNRVAGTVLDSSGDQCRVQVNADKVLTGVPTRAFGTGDRVELSIRPELIELDGAHADNNSITSTVNAVTYFGEFALLGCKTADGVNMNVKVPLSRFRQHQYGSGSQVTLAWQRSDCRVLDPLA